MEYQINKHCLFLGDTYQALKTFRTESFDCVWADPPYYLSNNGTTCHSGKRVSVNKGDWDRGINLTPHDQIRIAQDWLVEVYRVLKPNGTVWVSGTYHSYPSVAIALQLIGYKILNDIIWYKPSAPPNLGCRTFTHSTETLFWASKNKPYTFNYHEMKRENNGKQMRNLWAIQRTPKSEKKYGHHPTQKPLELVMRCLRASTNPGDMVLDPFMGSGTTGVACQLLDRVFVGVELNEQYFDIAKKRMIDACNQFPTPR